MTPPSSRRVLPIGPSSAARAREHAAGDVAVSVQVFRGALHREVDAHRERLLIDRAGKRVVDAGEHARGAAGRGDGRESTQRSVGLIGDSNHTMLVSGPITAAGVRSASSDTKRRTDAEARQQVLDEVKGPAVDRRRAHDFVARFEQAEERRGDRRHARTEHQRPLGAVDARQLLLHTEQPSGSRSASRGTRAPAPPGSARRHAPRGRRTCWSRRWASSTASSPERLPLARVNQIRVLSHRASPPLRSSDTRSPESPSTGSTNTRCASS